MSESEDVWKDKEWLIQKYYTEGKSLSQVSEEAGCGYSAIVHWMDKYGLDRRLPGSGLDEDKPHYDPEWLRKRYYEDGANTLEMADEAGVSAGAITGQMDKYGMERRTAADYHPQKDTLVTSKHDNHEHVKFSVNGSTHYYDVHRLLAIAEWGLDEVGGKIVHHKNGIGWDNRVENLELMDSQAEHARLHNESRERDELGRYV